VRKLQGATPRDVAPNILRLSLYGTSLSFSGRPSPEGQTGFDVISDTINFLGRYATSAYRLYDAFRGTSIYELPAFSVPPSITLIRADCIIKI